MREPDERLVTRSEIAELAGVNRPAVTNWAGRHADFPDPVDSVATGTGRADRFRAREVAEWLGNRRIPANKRRADEPGGTTYGERFLAALGGERRPSPKRVLTGFFTRVREWDADQDAKTLDLLTALTVVWAVRGGELSISDEGERWGWWDAVRSLLSDAGLALPDTGRAISNGPRADHVLSGAAHALAEAEWSRDGAAEALDWLIELRMGEASREQQIITPPGVRRLMADVLVQDAPAGGSVFDPFCRTGELLDACADALLRAGEPVECVVGAARTPAESELARMRLAVRGLPGRVEETDATRDFDHLGRYARVAANPPFNQRIDPGTRHNLFSRYGPPPRHSSNFAWLQLAVEALAPGGRAAVLMANIAAQSASPVERDIRAAMVRDGAVEALIALPPQLFGRATAVPVTLWLLRAPAGVPGEVLFVDGGSLGTMADRVRRVLSPADIATVADTYRRWRASRSAGEPFQGRPGFSASVSVRTLEECDWLLSPVVHVTGGSPAEPQAAAGVAGAETIDRLVAQLAELDGRAKDADRRADSVLAELRTHGWWTA